MTVHLSLPTFLSLSLSLSLSFIYPLYQNKITHSLSVILLLSC